MNMYMNDSYKYYIIFYATKLIWVCINLEKVLT
jgi:hypothetical protein